MKSKSVWVVEQGSYSDYRVVGVFSTEAFARTVASAINGPEGEEKYEDATCSEWELNPGIDGLRKGYKPYLVQMQKDGTADRVESRDVSGYEIGGNVQMWRRSTAPAYEGQGIADVLLATVWAKDERHAVKIANEHRTRMIADGTWETDKAPR